ncbi:serine/threonine protein kinase [Aspergillus campestris IBT 28561]|uniref:non-specific serine/threonine protein kinase n=1 Tax=Aspergillus campestris (strain IBT 28561) TaxID=1392248 RepID=A0A2I1D2G0_ASPC2|nr:serine/threonine protein kinase [Aspergillus campestris IBT 28561]PKY04061.1 serine/threonine protein kinase [Aspergillus campestris IBT 28561]
MRMADRPSSLSGMDEPINVVARNGQELDKSSKRSSDLSSEVSDQSPPTPAEGDMKRSVTKPPTAKLPLPSDTTDGQPAIRPTFSHLYHHSNTSRSLSTRTSSSSLQALNEGTVVDARSELGARPSPLSRRTSYVTQSESPPTEYPVYPDQSYEVLQSQVHPTYQRPSLWTRGSHHARSDTQLRYGSRPSRTAGNTPVSSPGLFSFRSRRSTPFESDDGRVSSPYLHPTHLQPPKETHTVEVDRDTVTGNKLINQYEILEELGRGEHGKVKLGRHVVTRQKVAIKIVQRHPKQRRLGKLGNPEDKVKKEVAILKKARHPNVVSLLEVIDDPNRQKVYIVLEYVENGEIIWRKRGLREIVHVDKRRLEREKAGIADSPSFVEECQQYVRTAQHLRQQREKARERRQEQADNARKAPIPAWSLEHGAESDEEESDLTLARTVSRSLASHEDPRSSPSHSFASALAAIEGSMYGSYPDDSMERRFSTASSSFGNAPSEPEWFSDEDDMSFVPCLTFDEARNVFRESLLGLEYLHYQGIIHRDIKPANLLVTSSYRVKISDFGVSYLGRPIRDDEGDQLNDSEVTELDDARELSKTVGTPAFYAPELCYTGEDFVETIGSVPRITEAIDVWSLGVTLYGMIFGRLPFVSDDEYSMFQTIVKKDVFIPRKRLVPVENEPNTVSQWPRSLSGSKRMAGELVYEDIDDELYDLLKRLLTKDPAKRVTVKEIKHHPWTLDGLPNPRVWVEETDPNYQSKGKRIEVSSEEVTSAVSKVPFIQRVRSNVAKWSSYLTGRSKDKDFRRRPPSMTPSFDTAFSASTSSFPRHLWDGRRLSLRDEDFSRVFRMAARDGGEHPLSQSVTASPVGRDDHTSYFQDIGFDWAPSHDRTPRPGPPVRTASSLSTAESAKTVRASNSATPLAAQRPESSSTTSLGGLFGGASRRLARGLHTGDKRSDKVVPGETAVGNGDRRSQPSLAVSVASAVGQMQQLNLLPEGDEPAPVGLDSLSPAGTGHRRNKSHQLPRKSSTDPLELSQEVLLRQRKGEMPVRRTSRRESEPTSNRPRTLRPDPRFPVAACAVSGGSIEAPSGGLTTSPPSAATISSSSVDDYTSGMSQSTSHPSIPSVVSGASSLSNEGFLPSKEKDGESAVQIPSILRTDETVKCPVPSLLRTVDDDEARYYCDDEEDSDDDSEDEVLVFGKKKPPPSPQKPVVRAGHDSQG